MVPVEKKNYYRLSLCVRDREDVRQTQVCYPVISADSVLLKPGGKQTVFHHINDKTPLKHLTDEEKYLLRHDAKHGGIVKLDENGHIPLEYVRPTTISLYYEFNTVNDLLNNNEFTDEDYGRLICVKDSSGDPRIHSTIPLDWVIYRLIDTDNTSDINSYDVILQKHNMDKIVYWDELDHGIQSSIQEIDKMVEDSHTHPVDMEKFSEDENGDITYAGNRIVRRDEIQAVIITEDESLSNVFVNDVAFLVRKVQELVEIDDSTITHLEPFKTIEGNQDEAYKGDMELVNGPKLRTQRVTSMKGFFQNCPNLIDYMWYDTRNCTDMSYMNQGCTRLVRIPDMDMSKVTTIDYFADKTAITRYGDIYSDSILSAKYVFKDSTMLQWVDTIAIPNAEDVTGFFYGCTSLVRVPVTIDISKANTVDGFFQNCTGLPKVSTVNMKNAISCKNMFKNCGSLLSISNLDMSRCINTDDMFAGCESLQYVGIVKKSLHTNISFANTMLSITALRNIIKGLDFTTPFVIDITNTPARNSLQNSDEINIALTGWRLKY